MIENPFLTPPQIESGASRSWAMGFAFGFQGPDHSSMTPADIQPEDADAFDLGVLAGQDAAINGLSFAQSCVDLNSEGPSAPHLLVDGTVEGGIAVFSLLKNGFHLFGSIGEGLIAIVTLSIALETFSDDPDTALEERAGALQSLLQRMGIEDSMVLFIGGAVDLAAFGCELLLTPIFRTQSAAEAAARATGRAKWLVVSWRTDQSNSIDIVAAADG
jgi:hypothetical protein